jgi:hypothetical protein
VDRKSPGRSGGPSPAAKALGVSVTCVRQWINQRNAPNWAPRLLWLCSPEGRHAIAEDVVVELRHVAGERDALRQEKERKERLLDEGRAVLAARVKALENENDELRKLLQTDALAEQLAMAGTVLDRLLQTLRGAQQRSRAA